MNKGPDNRPNLSRLLSRLLVPVDRLFCRAFGTAYNPLYQSGVLACLCLVMVLLSGLYLLVFYRVADPYGSTKVLQDQWFAGRWLRALHRYGSDLCLVLVAAHAGKMFLSGRCWGPRTLAWISGVLLTLMLGLLGLSGLVMVWDVQAQAILSECLSWLDVLPLWSEPLSRTVAGDSEPNSSFFFVIMFLHVAVPLGGAALLWVHVSRVARPNWLPTRALSRYLGLALLITAVVIPAALGERANLLRMPGRTPLDLVYAFWLPLAEQFGALPTLLLGLGLLAVVLTVPIWNRVPTRAGPSFVDERHCVGCTICAQDCPYDAIRMVPRTYAAGPRRSELVARVDPDRCVSCGICAGSCAPMGVGPPNRTGRDQLHQLAELELTPATVVVLACEYGPGQDPGLRLLSGVTMLPTGCAGSIHTSSLEHLLRKGASGVVVLACPERDCSHREGPHWLAQRVHRGREAELQARVDRARVLILHRSWGELTLTRQEIADFVTMVQGLPQLELGAASGGVCEVAPETIQEDPPDV